VPPTKIVGDRVDGGYGRVRKQVVGMQQVEQFAQVVPTAIANYRGAGIGAERAGWSVVSEMGSRVVRPTPDQKPSWPYGVNRAFTCVSLSVAPSPFRP
jgi:hypothetical protein